MKPTTEYHNLDEAFDFYNDTLFDAELPPCLITFTIKARMYGYFRRDSYIGRIEDSFTDEIALNPMLFEGQTDIEILSTLVHEMVHEWQHRFGNPSRPGYHNREWTDKMLELGLVPSHTGEPGGKQTGVSMSHYIQEGGRFELMTRALLKGGFELHWQARPYSKRDRKPSSKIKFTCPRCEQNAWASQHAQLLCLKCRVPLTRADL